MGIDGDVVDSDLVVEVGAGGAAGLTDVADDLTAHDALAGDDSEGGHVPVDGANAVAVVEDNFTTVAVGHAGRLYEAVAGGVDGGAHGGLDVHAGMECAFTIEGIFALAEAGADLAFDGPDGGRVGELGPVAGVGGKAAWGEATLKSAGDAAGKCLGLERVELVDGELDLLLADVVRDGEGGRGGRVRCGSGGLLAGFILETVDGGDFLGERAERGDLYIALVGDFGHLLVVFAEGFALLADLVEAFRLEEHAGIGTGETDDSKGANERGGYEAVDVVHGQRYLADATVFIPSDKQNVVTLTQHRDSPWFS